MKDTRLKRVTANIFVETEIVVSANADKEEILEALAKSLYEEQGIDLDLSKFRGEVEVRVADYNG